jgi:hypothetical protein
MNFVVAEDEQLLDTIERRSRLVTLAYQVLGTIDLPPLDASESEVLAALATAFHRKALGAVEADRDTPLRKSPPPENRYVSVFGERMRLSS